MNTCGREDCSSSCHRPEGSGRYCAPARCYCGGCPAYVPLPPRGEPIRAELAECLRCAELAPVPQLQLGLCLDCQALRRQELLLARPPAAPPPDAVTITHAPAEVHQLRAQLGLLAEEQLGPARHRALRDKATRRA